ncbi:MAG: hypothetical protein AABX79_00655 [Nanoarchaeota archaeon]
MAEKKTGEALGISGFTLAIAGLVSVLFSPLLSISMCLVGLIFCSIQQKNKKTKLGKLGLILNVLGLIASIIWLVFLIRYLIPLLGQQNFPSI